TDENIFGVIGFYSDKKGKFETNVLKLIKEVSYHLCTAISNIITKEKNDDYIGQISKYKQQLEEEKSYLLEEANTGCTYNDIIGNGPEMQKVFQQLSQV